MDWFQSILHHNIYIYISISTIIYLSYVGEISNNDISSWQPFHLFQSCQCIFLPCFLHAFIILTFLVFILILLNYHMFGRVSDSCLKAVTSCFNNSFPNIRFFPSSRILSNSKRFPNLEIAYFFIFSIEEIRPFLSLSRSKYKCPRAIVQIAN